jgi:hypothetical protein
VVHDGLEQRGREVVRLRLHVLRQRERHRPALARVGQHARDLRQGRDQLLGPGDPVEPAADRPERVVDRGRRVAEVLDLLQHRVGRAVDERVAGQQEQRQPVGVRDPGGGDHVQRPRPDRRGRDADLPAMGRLRVAHRRQRHALLVVTAPHRKIRLGQRRPQAQHVAVPEDREHAGEQRGLGAVKQHRPLRHQPPDQRLRRRRPH